MISSIANLRCSTGGLLLLLATRLGCVRNVAAMNTRKSILTRANASRSTGLCVIHKCTRPSSNTCLLSSLTLRSNQLVYALNKWWLTNPISPLAIYMHAGRVGARSHIYGTYLSLIKQLYIRRFIIIIEQPQCPVVIRRLQYTVSTSCAILCHIVPFQ